TGTGKTHTIEGRIDIPEEMGIIPRAAEHIFTALQGEHVLESTCTVSYLEIYNEVLHDLLSPADEPGAKLAIVDDSKQGKGVHCAGLLTHEVNTPEDVLRILRAAQDRRKIGETKMNKESSRSHCLFTLTVNLREKTPDGMEIARVGKLHMVDLAGSECAKTSGVGAQDRTRMREAMNINQSLLTLGRVITSLREKQGRIPYRDSKLTRLLQARRCPDLGGRCKTCIIATLSPSILCCEESLSTLSYAQSAHGIENKP
ncbi:hypothetical protein EMIHUDRAFT_44696, partial [Emiliania huxleyi CCMP1516]|uniref:Kinesin-like protein n=2 Tax=Emiliania huxleyi TaxID=2903 RepID=A0A0D3IWG3_EMIH1